MMKKSLIGLGLLLAIAAGALGQKVWHEQHSRTDQHEVSIRIDADLFRKKLSAGPPEWMVKQIQADLNSYKETGITRSMLDRLFSGKQVSHLNLIRFTISESELTFSVSEKNLNARQFKHLLAAFSKLHELAPLPDVDFIVSLEDGFAEDVGAPLFAYAKNSAAKSVVLIPDSMALRGYSKIRREMELSREQIPWEKRREVAFWRGSSTGGWAAAETWQTIPRYALALLSRKHPEELDAKITTIVQCDAPVPDIVRAHNILGDRVNKSDHLKYKYLVDVDGNSCSFERYFWLLLSHSLILKQTTPNIQWYYGALQPYVHYVPVKQDLSDLLQQCRWAREHDREAKKIAENAAAFAENNLSVEDAFLYLSHLLKEYAALQK